MTSSSSGYHAFILRFWPKPGGSAQTAFSLCYCLEDVETKARYLFHSIHEMHAFLGRLESQMQELSNRC